MKKKKTQTRCARIQESQIIRKGHLAHTPPRMKIAVPDLEEFIMSDGDCDVPRCPRVSRDLAALIAADDEYDVRVSYATAAGVQTLSGLPDNAAEGPRSVLGGCTFDGSLPARAWSRVVAVEFARLEPSEPRGVKVCLLSRTGWSIRSLLVRGLTKQSRRSMLSATQYRKVSWPSPVGFMSFCGHRLLGASALVT